MAAKPETVVEDTRAAVPDWEVGDALLAGVMARLGDLEAPELLATIGAVLGVALISSERTGRSNSADRPALLAEVIRHAETQIVLAFPTVGGRA